MFQLLADNKVIASGSQELVKSELEKYVNKSSDFRVLKLVELKSLWVKDQYGNLTQKETDNV